MIVPPILRLDVTGRPVTWVAWQDAVCLYARDMVAWTAGKHAFTFHGGYSRTSGYQTIVEVNSIIAVRGEYKRRYQHAPPLNNRELFRRDANLCMYCGKPFRESSLTRDHVMPVSRGGVNEWSNVVAACKRCNTHKSNKTPDEAGMPLLAIPYIPNLAEYLVLRNRKILVDQMDFLKPQFRHGRIPGVV